VVDASTAGKVGLVIFLGRFMQPGDAPANLSMLRLSVPANPSPHRAERGHHVRRQANADSLFRRLGYWPAAPRRPLKREALIVK